MDEEGAPWELLYNLGTALVQRGAAGDAAIAEKCLEQAGEVCREVRRSLGIAWLLGSGGGGGCYLRHVATDTGPSFASCDF